MHCLVRKLLRKQIIKEKNAFFLEKILPENDFLSVVEINDIVDNIDELVHKANKTATPDMIEEGFWDIRRKMAQNPERGKKLALCILMDKTIEEEYKKAEDDKRLLKLISTMVVQYI